MSTPIAIFTDNNKIKNWLIRPNRMEKNESVEEYVNEFERMADANN